MDYVIGSVAALISGNVTPNRPKLARKALTPTKHPASPNVTPKSEFVEDRSIFLSPTQQKKKAIVKKSPKRIFQNPDLDVTEDYEGNSSLASPKAEKVKKHLEEELDANDMGKKKSKSPNKQLDKSLDEVSPKKKTKIADNVEETDSTPKKKKRKNSEPNVEPINVSVSVNGEKAVEIPNTSESNVKKSKKKKHNSVTELQSQDSQATPTLSPGKPEPSKSNINNTPDSTTNQPNNQEGKKSKKRKKKNKKLQNVETNTPEQNQEESLNTTKPQNPNKKKKRKNKPKKGQQKSGTENVTPKTTESATPETTKNMDIDDESDEESEEVKSSNTPNPNAITEQDSDSEHDSDDEIESENEQENEKILADENQAEESSDEEEQEQSSKKKVNKNTSQQKENEEVMTEEEIKRTLFVGNVPFSSKCKKDIKKVFSQYGHIDTIRIRTIPVKDARVTPKLAIIKNELHPERTTVNVYIKYTDSASVSKALAENNTVLNGNHLRVSRSESTGAEHDPLCAVFVGNLPFAVEDETLRAKFENCGTITSVRIIRDKKTNAGKGFGYVNFASKDGVELALALSEEDLTIKNRILRVKRCTQQKPGGKPRGGGKGGKWGGQGQEGGNTGNQGQTGRWGDQRQGGGFRGGQGGGFRGGQRGGFRGGQGGGFRGGQSGGFRGGQGGGFRGGQRGGFRGGQGGGFRGNQGEGGGFRGNQGQGEKWGNQEQPREEGAARRLMNKRKQQDGPSEGPPSKRPNNENQPSKEKKPRKEFVGMTAEKKKKVKFDKGQKKKKALSEILTKKRDK